MKISLLLLLLASIPAAAQTSAGFSFKGNTLGMTLEQFKSENPGTIYINPSEPNHRINKKLTRQVSTPLCTDTYHLFPFEPTDLEPGEVACNASPGPDNPSGLTVAGSQVGSVIYRFFHDRLYRIDIRFAAVQYYGIKLAFIQRYGNPSERAPSDFQNAFGATWQGSNLFWQHGTQTLLLYEGQKNGPGQNQFDPEASSSAVFRDESLGPAPPPKEPLDF